MDSQGYRALGARRQYSTRVFADVTHDQWHPTSTTIANLHPSGVDLISVGEVGECGTRRRVSDA